MLPGIQYIRPLVDHAISAALCRCDDLRRPVCACGGPSLCDTCDDTAYGQDDNWVRINFARLQALDPALTNAEEILAVGYTNWVAGVVSANAPNGLFCLNVTFVEAPAEITRLSVGAQVVAVAAAGEYSFLLPKGERHEIEMSYVNEDISFSYFDAFTGRSVSRSRFLSLQNLSFTNIHTEITASSMSDEVELVVPSPNTPTGYITWNPSLSITPDHCFDPTYPILFCAFVDLPLDAYPSVRWTSDDGSVSSTGEWMLFDGDASLARDITVTASYGGVELTGYISIRQIVSETRIALATPSVIVVEDPYTNSPNEVVVRTSNTVKMSASWELAQSGRLLLESSDAAPTRVCVGPDMDEVPSFPYEIGTFKQNESGTCDFYLASTNMNVTGVGGTYTLRFVPDEGVELDSTTNVKIAKVRVEADANWPSNKVRHVFGPKEKAYVDLESSNSQIQLTGTLPHHGYVQRDSRGWYFVAPDQAGAFSVNASIDGTPFSIDCSCVAPISLRGASPRALTSNEWLQIGIAPLSNGEAGVITHIETYLEPDYVSFGHLRLFEGYAPPRGRQGWYLDTILFPDSAIGHTTSAGASANPATDYFTIGTMNKTSGGDYIGSWIGSANVYSNGSYRLDIPLSWYTVGCSVTNRMPDNVQTIWVYDSGSMRVNKNGISWQRDIYGMEYQP